MRIKRLRISIFQNNGAKIMDKERRMQLIEIYKKCSDDDLTQMIEDGEENFEEGAYELILAELKTRGFGVEADYMQVDEAGDKAVEEMSFSEMSTEDLMGILVNMHDLDELNFHLAAAEAIRRNIDATDIREYKRIVQCEQCSSTTDTISIEMIENPRPLIILKTIEEADLYADALDDEGIPYEIQVIIDDRDYRKAEMATNKIMLPTEEE
jgi:hypothetical protein